VTRKLINPNDASLAAAFVLPAYQRFRQWHRGQVIDLLCFVDNINENVKQLLEDSGAHPSREFRANCFAEVWEMPHDTLLNGRFAAEPCEIDKEISEAVCSGDKFSAATGFLAWGDRHEEEHKQRHVRSRLLEESRANRGRGR
jgi:hypothetical protein